MKIQVPTTREVDAKYLRLQVPVNYGVDDIPLDFYGRVGDALHLKVDMDTGIIDGWPGGAYSLDMKVRDEGRYILEGEEEYIIAVREGKYVPSVLPGGSGDYLTLHIGPDGHIANWHHWHPRADDVLEDFWPSAMKRKTYLVVARDAKSNREYVASANLPTLAAAKRRRGRVLKSEQFSSAWVATSDGTPVDGTQVHKASSGGR